jgi:hypothetical protein
MNDDEAVTLLPTAGMAFRTQVLIMRAYVVLTESGQKPIHYLDVVRRANLHRTQVSGVNSFFVGLGMLVETENGKYLPTDSAVVAFQGTPGSEDFSSLREPLQKTRLFQFVRDQLMIQDAISSDDLERQLIAEAWKGVRSRARRSLQWLEAAGLIRITEDSLVVLSEA